MSSESTVWSILGLTQQVQYGIPFIDPAELKPIVDADNFAFKQNQGAMANGSLHIGVTGDLTGNDSVNTGGQQDSYIPTTIQDPNVIGKIPGHTVSVSRGTRQIPLVTLTGDLAGEFSGYGYMGNELIEALSYRRLGGMRVYTNGASATNPGGELRWSVKNNAVTADVEVLKLLYQGATPRFAPMSQGLVGLGAPDLGFRSINLDYTITATVGAVEINKPSGRVIVAAGAASIVVTNSLVTTNSIVLVTPAQVDAGNRFVLSVVASAGFFTITLSGNVTANQAYNFLVINTDN